MKKNTISRRKFVSSATVVAVGSSAFGLNLFGCSNLKVKLEKDVVSIVRIKDGNIAKAVEEANETDGR